MSARVGLRGLRLRDALLAVSRATLVLCTALVLGGCLPSGSSASDEERDPHFLAGKTCVSAMDHQGAIECFEKALQANPGSSCAHFELALLLDQKEADFAAAIYHYESYLRLRPHANNTDMVKMRIGVCKQQLAKGVNLGAISQTMQAEFEKLTEENRRLREELDKWKAYAGRLATQASSTLPNTGSVVLAAATTVGSSSTSAALSARNLSTSLAADSGRSAIPKRTYTVKPGDTLATIARQYGVKLDTLMSNNPGVEPRRLKVGQSLNLP